MLNYWLERVKLRKQTNYTVEILLRNTLNQIVQLQELDVNVLHLQSNFMVFEYKSLDSTTLSQIKYWRSNPSSYQRWIIRIKRYDGLGIVVNIWEIDSPILDFSNFNTLHYEISLKFNRLVQIK